MTEEKTRRYLVINENGTVEHHEMPFKKKWDLKELQDKVEGYIQLAQFKINGKKYSGYTNEDYQHARRPLLPNFKATRHYHGYYRKDGIEEMDRQVQIAGQMVLLKGPIIVENFKGDEKEV